MTAQECAGAFFSHTRVRHQRKSFLLLRNLHLSTLKLLSTSVATTQAKTPHSRMRVLTWVWACISNSRHQVPRNTTVESRGNSRLCLAESGQCSTMRRSSISSAKVYGLKLEARPPFSTSSRRRHRHSQSASGSLCAILWH
jgi:gentisate 1,2-dioxygenase